MAEILYKDLSPALKEQFERGKEALQKENWDYAIALFMSILKQEQGFYPGREALRGAQIKKGQGKSGFFKKVLGSAGKSPMLAKAQINLRTNPKEAIVAAEEVLNGGTMNLAAHRVIGDAALACDLPKTAVLSYEIVLKHDSADIDSAMKLGAALVVAGNISRAEIVHTELEKLHPNNPQVAQALKNVAARKTMASAGYQKIEGGDGSYRDILKDEKEAVALEQESRQVKDSETAVRLIEDYKRQLEEEPDNLKLARKLADLLATDEKFDQALEYYNRLLSSEGGEDPELAKLVAEVKGRKLLFEIEQLDSELPDFEENKKALLKEREALLLEDCVRRSGRFPNDLQIRFELGEMYFARGKVGEAIREFQKAQNNPNRRTRSLMRLGQLFTQRGMNDLAVRSLQNAITEKNVFDDEKKELLYSLGSVFEKMGKSEDAIEEFKKIYEVDIEYRDVSERVDAYYENLNQK